jgi:hypothetical protein
MKQNDKLIFDRGSWQERQIVDEDPYVMKQDDRRAKIEFYMPLIFYLFAWLNFFMVIPRSWSKIEKQSDANQQRIVAQPAGTDVRFKAGAILACAAYAVIIYALRHNMHYYKPHPKGIWAAITNFCHYCPTKLFLTIIIVGIRLAYGVVMAWEWETSIFKFDSNPAWFYGLGYAPTLLVIVIFNIAGYVDDNEDQAIMEQRRQRGRAADAEIGIVKRPNWWKKGRALDDEGRLRDLMDEVGGGRPTANRISTNVELMNIPRHEGVTSGLPGTGALRDRSRSRPRDDPFRDQSVSSDGSHEGLRPPLNQRPSSVVTDVSNVSGATGWTGRTLTSENVKPQRVRSMLDI